MTEVEELKRKIASVPETRVKTKSIRPNSWNFNMQSDRLFNSLKEALRRFGRLYPVIVREVEDEKYEIIDGEHRWKALLQLGVESTPVKNLGRVSDVLAKELMTILNKTRGEANPEKLGLSLSRIVRAMEESGEDPLAILPYDAEQLKRLMAVSEELKVESTAVEIVPEEWDAMRDSTRLCTSHNWRKRIVRRCVRCGTLEL